MCLPVCFLCQASERPRASAAECSSFFFRTLCFSLIPVLFLCPNNSYFLLCSELNMWSEPPDYVNCFICDWQKVSRPQLFLEMFRACFMGLVDASNSSEGPKWATFTFLKVHLLLCFHEFSCLPSFFSLFVVVVFFLFPLFEMYINCSFFNFSLFKFSVLMAPGYF